MIVRLVVAAGLLAGLGGCGLTLLSVAEGLGAGVSVAASSSTLLKNECNATIGSIAAGQPLQCGPQGGTK